MLRKLSQQERYDRRLRREKRWSKPMTGRRRLRAWANMLLHDHGIFRMVYLNEHVVDEDMKRSAQPAPHHIARWGREGVKTIINLRGGRNFGSFPLEREAVDAAGMALVDLTLRSRMAPDKQMIADAKDLFASIEYPAVMHCKSGADRTGVGAFLYLMLHKNRPFDEASKQLSLRFGHIRSSKTGVLDHFIETYQQAHAESGISFQDWVENEYDPDAVNASFKPSSLGTLLGDIILRRE